MAESRRVVKLCGAAGIALLALTGSALADGYEGSIKDAPKPEREFAYSFTLAVTSDYVFRGISQTDSDPALQGSAGFTYGIFYAGVWASTVDWRAEEPEYEADYYAGIKPTWGKFTFDLGVIYYDYPGTTGIPNNEALELKAGVSLAVTDALTVGGTIYYSPDYNTKEYEVYEATAAYALPKFHIFSPTVSGTYGFVDWDPAGALTGFEDYSYWNAGLTLAVDKLAFDLRYWDTDLSSGDCGSFNYADSICDGRFVATVTLALP